MGKQISIVKHENTILPGFRKKISRAESTEDVKKFFVYSVRELLVNIFQDKKFYDFDVIKLSPMGTPHYEFNKSISSSAEFSSVWKNSDLPRVIGHMAEAAIHRHWHLEKKPEKTTSKIRN